MNLRLNLGIIIFIVAATFSSCKKKDICLPATPATPSTPAVATEEIIMQNTVFSPVEKTISVGTTVRWVNKDAYAHTVTANDNSFDSGNMDAGQTFEFTFNSAGTFDYRCIYHTAMVGKIIVQ